MERRLIIFRDLGGIFGVLWRDEQAVIVILLGQAE
jgi:hypothetical protein